MQVYKFGGASLTSPERIKNMFGIVCDAPKPLAIVVSAMGKTTNALERVLEAVMEKDERKVMAELGQIFDFHDDIICGLELDADTAGRTKEELRTTALQYCVNNPLGYSQLYDMLVSYGEILSSEIIYAYLESQNLDVKFVDMRKTLNTNNRFRVADVDMERSVEKIKEAVDDTADLYIMQGFIGGTLNNEPTTLGREGSDYSAALVAYALEADSITIWKDVEGILNADPREFDQTLLIPHLSYHDAAELAYSGAQVIPPKTIRPLQNKNIPLYVKCFLHPEGEGSVIDGRRSFIDVPVYIIKKNQLLISMMPKDFSFALEHSLERVFTIFNKHKQSISIIQSSAIQISVGVDEPRRFDMLLEELNKEFIVKYNRGLELITIRGYRDIDIANNTEDRRIYMKQQTRRIVRILRNSIA